jgi:hypothetical protein
MNFGSLLIFLGLNKSENGFLNPRIVTGPIQPRATAHGVWRPAMCSRPKSGPRRGNGARALGALAAWSPRAARARDDAVTRSLAALWRLASSKVLPVSSRVPQGGHRARRLGVELTRMAARRRGGGGCFGRRHSSAGGELRWPVVMEARPCSVGAEEGR